MKIPPKILGKIAWYIMRFIGETTSIETIGREIIPPEKPVIYVGWHGRLFFPMYCFRKRGITILVSEHRDGEIIASSIKSAGNATVRGSTTRGGVKALARIVKLVRDGRRVAITPDGPRGPKCYFQPGAVYVAAKTGIPIIPLGGSARRAYYFKSWDSFQLPLPFSKGVFAIGEPYNVTGGLDEENIEYHRAELERRLMELNSEADKRAGVPENR